MRINFIAQGNTMCNETRGKNANSKHNLYTQGRTFFIKPFSVYNYITRTDVYNIVYSITLYLLWFSAICAFLCWWQTWNESVCVIAVHRNVGHCILNQSSSVYIYVRTLHYHSTANITSVLYQPSFPSYGIFYFDEINDLPFILAKDKRCLVH